MMQSNPKPMIIPNETLHLNMLLTIAMVLQFVLLNYYFKNLCNLETFLTIIFVFTLLLSLYTWFCSHYYNTDVRNHIISCLFLLFLGPLGCFIAIVNNTFSLIYSRKMKVSFSEWLFGYLYNDDHNEKDSDRIYKRIVSGQEIFSDSIDTEPLTDIMGFGTLEQKQAALIKAVKHFRPQLMIPVLQMGLNDSNNAIRVQAAAGLAKIQDDFHKKYTFYERKVLDKTESPEELVDFAKLCEEYSASQLLNSERKAAIIRESITLYERCVVLTPDNIDLKISLIRMHMLNGNRDRAYALLTEVLPLIKNPSPAIAHTIMELLFKMGRFAEMRHFANEWKSEMDKNFGYAINEKLELWSGNVKGLDLDWKTK